MQTNTAALIKTAALIERAWACRDGDHAAGLALAELAVQEAECRQDRQAQGPALAAQGFFLLRLKRDPEARLRLTRGLEISRSTGEHAAEAECLYYLGEERTVAEQYTPALEYFFAAERLYDALEDRSGQAEAFNAIGTLYNLLGDHSQAIRFHLLAFRQREALGDKKNVACSLNNIGNAYGHAEDYVHSVLYHEQCLAASRSNGQTRLEALCLSNLSIGYSGLNRLPDAIDAGKAALELARIQQNPQKQCYALMSIGRACEKGQEHDESITWFTNAVALAGESGSRRDECEAKNALGSALLSAGRIAEALPVFTQAEETAADLKLTQFRAQALAGLSQVSENLGDMAAALNYHKECYALEKTLSSEAADKRTKTLMMQMEVEKVQKEAQLHQLKNVELAALNAALEDANQTLHAQAQALQEQAELLEAQSEELRAQADELQRQATEDGLTGLANRRHLESRLAARFTDSRRTGAPLSIAMADVDHFKSINDRFGHQVGDEVLMSVGLLLRHACRETDLAARYGGEEFVLVLPGTETGQAHAACERVRQAVENYAWHTIHPELAVTVSMGVSDDPNAPSHERLLGLADARLYEAKHAGRNRVVSASISASAGRQVGGQKRQRQRPGLTGGVGIVRSAGVAEEAMIRL